MHHGSKTQHLVVVEDETAQRDLLVAYLQRQNYHVTGVESATAFRTLVADHLPALALLDIGLPDESGLDLARWMRGRSASVGIVMVTAAGQTLDRVTGLDTGADDYIAKPFEARELLARVKGVLRRRKALATEDAHAGGSRVRMGRRLLDLERRVLVDPESGAEDALAASEFRLLRALAESPNRVLARGWLLETFAARDGESLDRTIDLRIARLRKKIEVDAAHPNAIRTVRGIGYMFVPDRQ